MIKGKKLWMWAVVCLVMIIAAVGIGRWAVSSGAKEIKGYMIIQDNILYLDELEIITLEDTKRIDELGLEPAADMPDGYYIYNADTEQQEFALTDKTTYTFVDFNLLFVKDEDGDRQYTTTNKAEFLQYLDTSYADYPRAHRVPFFIKVKNGKVISVTEKFEYTI